METESKQLVKPAVNASGGALTFNNLDSLQRLTIYLHASKMLPKQYDTPEKIGAGIQYAVQLGFNETWLLALRQIAVINGTPSMFGDLPLALVRASGQLVGFDEYLVDKDSKKICLDNGNIASQFYAAVCTVKRKDTNGNLFQSTETFSIDDAKTAGVWGRNVWAVYPKRMIAMRVRSMALKNMFADILNGMSIGEYDANTVIEKVIDCEVESAPLSGADRLNALATQAQQEPAPSSEAPAVIVDTVVEQKNPEEATGSFAEFTESRPTV